MVKARLVLPVLAACAALAIAGCGGGGDSSSPDLAGVAPPGAGVYIEATLQPKGAAKTDIDAIAKKVGGFDDLGSTIVSEIEKSAKDSGEPLDFDREVKPWLGEKASIFLTRFDGNDFAGTGIAVQATNIDEATEFVDKRVRSNSDGPVKEASYKGVDYIVDSSDGSSVGAVGGFIVYAKDQRTFKEAVEASEGESLGEAANYTEAISAAPRDSVGDVYVDIGGLLEQSKASVDPQALELFENAGLDLEDATAVASVIPGSDQVEVDISSNLSEAAGSTGPAADLLGTMPADSFAALAASGFGKRLGEGIDALDAAGIPGQVPPHQLEKALKQQLGVDLRKVTTSLGDAAVFAEGGSRESLRGALVLTESSAGEAVNTVSSIGLLLRATGTPGVTALSADASGFSIPSGEPGRQPIVVAAKGERVAIGYGLAATLRGLNSESGRTLSETTAFKNAAASLGGIPISAFADGPAALKLAESLSGGGPEFEEVAKYLKSIEYIAIGTQSSGDSATVKAIVGLEK
jgi:hypothetical protein